jgi:hypothetical protein
MHINDIETSPACERKLNLALHLLASAANLHLVRQQVPIGELVLDHIAGIR